MSTPLSDLLGEARKALRCLFIAVEGHVAEDVQTKVEAAFTAQSEALRTLQAELDIARDGLKATADHRARVETALYKAQAELDHAAGRENELRAQSIESHRLLGEAQAELARERERAAQMAGAAADASTYLEVLRVGVAFASDEDKQLVVKAQKALETALLARSEALSPTTAEHCPYCRGTGMLDSGGACAACLETGRASR